MAYITDPSARRRSNISGNRGYNAGGQIKVLRQTVTEVQSNKE